jgi:GxxExxY protein
MSRRTYEGAESAWNRGSDGMSEAGYEQPTRQIIGCAMKVHSVLGPGLLESAHGVCLEYELNKAGLTCQRELPISIHYEELCIEIGYRIDFLVESKVVLELKSVDNVIPVHKAKLISYVKLGHYPVGLLINFNVEHLRDGIHRLYPPR